MENAMALNTPLTSGSAWVPPDSWDIRPPGLDDFDATVNPASTTLPDPPPLHALKSSADILLWTPDRYKANNLSPDDEGSLNVHYPSGYHSTITCKIATTAKDLLVAAMKQTRINDWTKHNLVVSRNGLDRNLDLSESPLLLVWSFLQHVGYSVTTKPDPSDWASHTYLCSFHFKKIVITYVSISLKYF